MRALLFVPAALIAAVVVPTIPATGSAEVVAAASAISPTDNCLRRYRQVTQLRYIRAVYHRQKISKTARRKIRYMMACSHSEEATSNIRHLRREQSKARKERARAEAIAASLPPVLNSIAQCESGGNPRAISSGGTYRGKFQFSFSTWASVGGSGDPAAASEDEQNHRAAILLRVGGLGHWPVCGAGRH